LLKLVLRILNVVFIMGYYQRGPYIIAQLYPFKINGLTYNKEE